MKKLAFSVFAAALTFGANAANEVAETQSCCGFSGVYFGLGAAVVDNGIKVEYSTGDKDVDQRTRIAAAAAMGYGKVLKEKAYLGLEAGLDASQNFESGTNAKVNGLTPSIALKLGYVHAATKSMVFLKAGAAYSKANYKFKESNKDYEIKNANWSPIIALGGEKLCGKVRTRLEAEYRFRASKSLDHNDMTTDLVNRGAVTLRAMAIYTIKM